MAQLGAEKVEIPRNVFHPDNPLPTARAFVRQKFWHEEGLRTIHHHGGQFFVWDRTRYREVEEATIMTQLYNFLEKAITGYSDGEPVPFRPTNSKVREVLAATKAETHLPTNIITIPSWFGPDKGNRPDPRQMLVCSNGLLHLQTMELFPSTAAFFSTLSLSFPFDPHAPQPVTWYKFLEELWPNDPESISTLQEIFGYFLVPDTRQQKLFLFVGPKRSGKGTIGRVLRDLLGPHNVSAPTFASLSKNFGLQPLIGKQLAIISDARIGPRTDSQVIVERLLSISGEDAINIDRKYLSQWTGQLSTRFLILTNELFRTPDASGAFASRFIILKLVNSFYGREDIGLTNRLLEELPGILNWAISGWQRLQGRGYFTISKSATETVQQFENLGSPLAAFVRNKCILSAEQETPTDKLHDACKSYCNENDIGWSGNIQAFGRDLRAVVPNLAVKQRRKSGKQVRYYVGIGLR